MWAYFLANYAKYGYILLGVLLLSKLFLTILFQNYERSVVGVIGSMFKWYGVIDRDLAEDNAERFAMWMQNLLNVFLYVIAAMMLFMKTLFS